MVKENIIISHKTKIGIAEELWTSQRKEDMETAHPEIEFVPFSRESSLPENLSFLIGDGISPHSASAVSPEILQDPILFWDLKRRAKAYSWLMDQKIKDLRDLYEAWYKLKFLCQEIRNPLARKLGREMADLTEDAKKEVLDAFKNEILFILTLPSSSNRIRNSLWKNYSNQLKRTRNPLQGIKTPEDQTGDETLLLELKLLEEEALKTRLFFGTSPVLFREKR